MTAQEKPRIGIVVPDDARQPQLDDTIAGVLASNAVDVVAVAGYPRDAMRHFVATFDFEAVRQRGFAITREAAESFSRVDVYAAPLTMLDDRLLISGVVIVGPLELQAWIAIKRGCHVLCDPPNEMTRIAAAESVAVAAKRGLVVAFGRPLALQLAPVLHHHRIGPITQAAFEWPEDAVPSDPHFGTADLVRHAVSTALTFFDSEPESVRAWATAYHTTGIEISFKDGRSVKVLVGWTRQGSGRLVLSGETGSLEVPVLVEGQATTYLASTFDVIHRGPGGQVTGKFSTRTHAEAMVEDVDEWARAIKGKEMLVPLAQRALLIEPVLNAACDSVMRRKARSLGPWVSL